MSYVAFVPARAGSKRLPGKNVMLLADKPLLAWTLQTCVEVKKIDRVILSTDSMEYWNIAKKHVRSDKLILDHRDPAEAGDTVKIFDYLKKKRTKIFGDTRGAFVLALPTVPLRTARHIGEAIEKFEQRGMPIFSATTYGFPISFAFRIDATGAWSPVFRDSPMITGNTRSQNQEETYHPNGAIYVRMIEDLAQPGLRTFYQGAEPFLMERAASVDIDSDIDLALAEVLLR